LRRGPRLDFSSGFLALRGIRIGRSARSWRRVLRSQDGSRQQDADKD
jgi:hypothetical protein